jgi:hypothetical protein
VRLAGVWSQAVGWFSVLAFDWNLAAASLKMFSHLIYFKKKFYVHLAAYVHQDLIFCF